MGKTRLGKIKLTKMQVALILGGIYIFLQMVADIAASKIIHVGFLVMDAGIIYSFTFTWRDLVHKQLGKKAAQTLIILAGVINVLMVLYFQFVIFLPPEAEWLAAGGQSAWLLVFGIVPRIVVASIIAELISELIDTEVYQWWTSGFGKGKAQYWRVFTSNAISIPIDSALFTAIAFAGILSPGILFIMFLSNIFIKVVITLLSFWMIYLVPEKPLYSSED
ncbi:MAG TPA: queuosine precursor transporter [Candidatus Nanoarchaeia archaeon]|nr:queuosine precursor transporter [Candidatus Nanoarchaeia archaeon]